MKPGDKIDLIRRCARELATMPWTDIDLCLAQFGLSTESGSGQTKYDYAVANLEHGPDASLLALDEYLHGEASQDRGRAGLPLPWEKDSFRLFFSHSSHEKKFAYELKDQLASWAIDLFVAHEDIEPSSEWEKVIEQALDTCDALAAYLSTHFHASLWTDQEVGWCIEPPRLQWRLVCLSPSSSAVAAA